MLPTVRRKGPSQWPGPRNPPWRTAPEIEKKVLHLRRTYHFRAQRIAWFLQRYHGVEISEGGVRGTLTRHGLQRLPRQE